MILQGRSDGSQDQTMWLPEEGWDDLRFPASHVKPGPANPPDWVAFSGLGTVYALGFNKNISEDVHFIVQLPHSWNRKAIRPHIHWTSNTGNAGDVAWVFEYTVASVGGVFGTTIEDTIVVSNPAQYAHKLSSFEEINLNEKVSCILMCRLYRHGANVLDTLDEDAFLLEFDIHYKINSIGSGIEYPKY